MNTPNANGQLFNIDGLNISFKRHTRKTGDKVTKEQIDKVPTLTETHKFPNKDKSIYYKHPSVEQTFEIDISDCTPQQVFDMCADTAVILQQKLERALPVEKMQERKNVKIDVASLLESKRVAATPEETIEKNFDKLTPDARKALLAKLSQ